MVVETARRLEADLGGDLSEAQRMLVEDVALDTLLLQAVNRKVASVQPHPQGQNSCGLPTSRSTDRPTPRASQAAWPKAREQNANPSRLAHPRRTREPRQARQQQRRRRGEAMSSTEPDACLVTVLTQSDGHSQPCANPFCKVVVEIRSPRGKHGRYCSPKCRSDGYALRRARALCCKSASSSFTGAWIYCRNAASSSMREPAANSPTPPTQSSAIRGDSRSRAIHSRLSHV
jgi:hypothetical protein